MPLSESWPDAGMWDCGGVYELVSSEPVISENACSLWPTASASIANDGESQKSWEARRQRNLEKGYNGNGMGTPLTIAATTWPTANTRDSVSAARHTTTWRSPDSAGAGGPRNRQMSIGDGHQVTIAEQAEHWATPQAHDGHPGNPERVGRYGTEHGAKNLTDDVTLWKTPHGMSNRDQKGKVGGCGGGEFALQANHWQTPATDSFRSRGGDRREEMGLDQQARHFTTPAAGDWRPPNTKTHKDRCGKPQEDQLPNFVEYSFQASRPVPATRDGLESSQSGQTSRRHWSTPNALDPQYTPEHWQERRQQKKAENPQLGDLQLPLSVQAQMHQGSKRRLNPRFVEWLMGLPIGWTEL